jgi:hypothetical protein
MGILITLYEPTEPMKQAAMEAEYYESPTLLKGSKPILPHTH